MRLTLSRSLSPPLVYILARRTAVIVHGLFFIFSLAHQLDFPSLLLRTLDSQSVYLSTIGRTL